MSNESAASNTHNTQPDLRDGGELRRYSDGRVDVVFKNPGMKFSMAELADHFTMNPVDQDSGAAVIQAVGADGRPQTFYMDMGYAVPKDQPWLVAHLDKFPVTDPAHDITVGEPWQSPFGATGPIHGVVLPYNHGVRPEMYTVAAANLLSTTAAARQSIDQVLGQ